MSDVYRQAASMLVLRPVSACGPDGCDAIYQLLLLHKPRKNDSWQLPQGGVEEGETTEQTALRELMEEASIQSPRVLGKSKKVYQYDFPPSYRRFRRDNVCGQHIAYVFAAVPENASVTVDGKEVDAYAWIDIAQLSQYIKRPEYRTLVEELYGEAVKIASGR
jgi:8-oxo-dGTP pyrophosphatase MutT (NUDIX family)